ncbi:hypothetical protein C8Q76DRAFT_693440 [Earliella scabrosa]|nr:hypothetical protein C8Q76DRAFT_693440 [Earliella scabrosa]
MTPDDADLAVVEYCSKQCQKAAWSVHRRFEGLAGPLNSELDTKASELLRALNYPTPAELFSEMREWAESHMWCLLNITEALLYLGNVSRVLIEERARGPQGWRMAFILSPGVTDVDKRTPLNAFRIKTYMYGWDDDRGAMEQDRARIAHSHQIANAKGQPPPCALPVAYYLDGMNIAMNGILTLSHVRPLRAAVPPPRNIQVAVADLIEFSMANVNAGAIAWRFIKTDNPPVPVIGDFVRVKKKWEWMPRASDWDTIQRIVEERVGYKFQSGLRFQQSLTIMKTLSLLTVARGVVGVANDVRQQVVRADGKMNEE